MLNKEDKGTALRYSLKQAIYHLGPTGFPFEVYVSKLFENYGYKTKTNLNLKGKCISHEVDVIAEKGKEKILIECKFHSKPWIYSSIQTALYCYSRFMDINENPNLSKKYTKLLLVSSTKFSRDVRKYAKCKDIDVLGWGYPRKDSLQKMIEDKKLYPLTLLKSIDNNSKHILLENQYILLKDIIDAELEVLIEKTGIPSDKLKRMRKEALLV